MVVVVVGDVVCVCYLNTEIEYANDMQERSSMSVCL